MLSKLCTHFAVNISMYNIFSYSPFLSYFSQILASKGAKDFSIQFSSTVFYFTNLRTEEEEDVFIVLLLFFGLLEEE